MRQFIPKEKHVTSKKETFTVEGYNSLFRHFLARLRRKTKCYTKAKYMLVLSVQLLMLKWDKALAILFLQCHNLNEAKSKLLKILDKQKTGINEKQSRELMDTGKKVAQILLENFIREGLIKKEKFYIHITPSGKDALGAS